MWFGLWLALVTGPLRAQPAPGVGHRLPNLPVQGLDGRTVGLQQLREASREHTLVVCIWCATCPSCRGTEGALNELALRLHGQVAVVAVDCNYGETPERVHTWLADHDLSFPVYLDPQGRLADYFKLELTTTTLVVDSGGVVRYLGQFAEPDHPYAAQALRELRAGREVTRATTVLRG